MRYLKRLKNELQALTEKLTVKGPLPEYVSVKKLHRQAILEGVIALVNVARGIDHEFDFWKDETSQEWHFYLINLKHWLGQAPKLPNPVPVSKPTLVLPTKELAPEPNLRCKLSHDDSSYEVIFSKLTTTELLSVRNAIILHADYTQDADDVLQALLDAFKASGIDLGDYPLRTRPWLRGKTPLPDPHPAWAAPARAGHRTHHDGS